MNLQFNPQSIDGVTDAAMAWLYLFVPQLIGAVLVLAIGLTVVHFGTRAIGQALGATKRIDISVRQVLVTALRYALIIVVGAMALTQLGVQTASLFAVLGAAGLAIGLALQGTLTNIAAGVMLLWLRPFRVGDYIEVANQGIAGTVREMSLFNCLLQSEDGVRLFAPNAQVWNYAISNYRRNERRLVEAQVTLPPETNVDAALKALSDAVAAAPFTGSQADTQVFVEGVTGDGYVVTVRFWTGQSRLGDAIRGLYDTLAGGLAGSGLVPDTPIKMTRRMPAPGTAASYAD